MNRILLDDAVTKELAEAGERVTLCDSQGHVLGYFQPAGPQRVTPEMLQWAKDQISDEELDRRSQQPGGISTDELLDRLNRL